MDLQRFIQEYTDDVYHAANPEAAERYIADPCIRHEHGHLVVMSLAENKARIAGFLAQCKNPRFRYVAEAAQGDLYSSAYEYEFTNAAGERETFGSIEIFKIEDGKITETWNAAAGHGAWG